MYTADKKSNQRRSSIWRRLGGVFVGFMHRLMAFVLLGMAGNALAAPASTPIAAAGTTTTAAVGAAPSALPPTGAVGTLMNTDLSVLGMYQHADVVVKTVMIGLLLASVVTWAIFFGKSASLMSAKKRIRREYQALEEARTLDDATDIAAEFKPGSVSLQLLTDARNEQVLSERSDDNNGIKERTAFRFERRVAATGRQMGRGTGYLATVGAIAPFIGLFGTVWGIMNSFIGIAQSQTTNLAVVAPGIAEALLATAIGLVAAIPAVVIYNVFARWTASYKAMVGDVAAQVLLLQSRDLDIAASVGNVSPAPAHQLRVG